MRTLLTLALLLLPTSLGCRSAPETPMLRHMSGPADHTPSLAYRWLDVMLEAAARDVERIGARPTILSRQMAIPILCMFEVWAAHDEHAVGPIFGSTLRRPRALRTDEAVRTAISHAMYVACLDQYPHHAEFLRAEMRALGPDSAAGDSLAVESGSPAVFGQDIARRICERRHHDGSNQLGDHPASSGEPYSDTTGYVPVNTPDHVVDPDRWQPIPFDDGHGGKVVHGFLTPHWQEVEPLLLDRADRYRPGPPPLVGSEQLRREVDEVIALNASLDPDQKALVEFMRDGPRSTGQSGHWLRFAQDVSVRDRNDLDEDVKLFFAVGATAMDAFIASWESKRTYDSSRPWTLVRHLHAGETLRGWAGPGKGVVDIPADEWHPYSPSTFITPPFPGYVSGHSTISGACAEMLRLFTGSDRFDVLEERRAGALTEADFECEAMQQVDGEFRLPSDGSVLSCDVSIPMPTFTEAAELAGISRVLGGYHIQADNVEGLRLGRSVARDLFPKVKALIAGTP